MATNMQIDTPPASQPNPTNNSPLAQAHTAQIQNAQNSAPPPAPPQQAQQFVPSAEETKILEVLRQRGFNSVNNFDRVLKPR